MSTSRGAHRVSAVNCDRSTDLGSPVKLSDRISREFLLHHRLCPLGALADGSLLVAVTRGSLMTGLDDLSVAYGRVVVVQTLSEQNLDGLIARLVSTETTKIELAVGAEERDEPEFARDIRDLANQPPVVRFVSLLLREAYEAGASDVHLEATRTGLRSRYRIDGVLIPGIDPPERLDRAVVSRLKLLAELDIAERRRPQDGRIRVRLERRELDLRVSTVPTVFGESVVLRLLDRGVGIVPLESLGLSAGSLAVMQRLARQSTGMVLVTGPTGSGKSTTLYSALGLRSATSEKIVTIEDPVEYTLEGVTQVPVHAPTGVTFASVLRSILRQDPDVIFVGEMRDAETAELAVQAALTGHMLFSTLHTNDAIGAIPRLLDLGVAPFLLTATLEAVLAQRLVRRVCDACREPYQPDITALHQMDEMSCSPSQFTRGRGCNDCRGTGYRGRTGIFELLMLTDDLKDAVAGGAPRSRLTQLAADAGMLSMRNDGYLKVRDGLTTVEEVLRVTQS